MVIIKTPFGRYPGRKNTMVLRSLRHRRRTAAAARLVKLDLGMQQGGRSFRLQCSFKTFEDAVSFFEGFVDGLNGKDGATSTSSIGTTQSLSTTSSTVSVSDEERTSNEESRVGERQVVPYFHLSKKMVCRSISDVVVGNFTTLPGLDRSRSDSNLYLAAIPLPPPPSMVEVERPQHPDEETDRYLAHLFTRSPINFTDDQTTQDNDTEEFAKLRNLFSSEASTKRTLRTDTSCETSYGLNTLFFGKGATKICREQCCFKPGLASALSDASLGLNTLFGNNKTTLKESTSCETTSMGLRTLFDEKRQPQTTTSTLGLNTLFNGDKEEATVGSPSPRSHVCSCQCKTGDGLPSVASSSSLLGNLFASDGDELLTVKERKKAIIAKDLAQYLASDYERTHPKSTSLSTFVQQIEALFDDYRSTLRQMEDLQAEIAEFKRHQ